ncbi:MAG: hypothetical protein KF788_05505 [Piscinibacter sp.]|nr:hypothetical protein [Piscinibacter sp.]
MFGLTTLGIVHTAISLVAVAAGAWALARDKAIEPDSPLGRTYLWTTALTCLTGFGIFQHGGFGKPHALGVLTLLVLAAVLLARRTTLFGRLSRHVVTIAMTTTFFFHMVPGLTETFTRLPADAPLFSSPEDPALLKLVGVFFVLYLIGVALQVRRLRAGAALAPAGGAAIG